MEPRVFFFQLGCVGNVEDMAEYVKPAEVSLEK